MKLCWLVCCEVLALASLVLYHWPHLLWGVSSSFASVAFSISFFLDKQFRCYTQVFKFESELVFLKQEQGIIWKQIFPLGHLTKIFIVKHHLSFHPPGVSCMGRNNRWEMDWGGNSSPSLTEIISCGHRKKCPESCNSPIKSYWWPAEQILISYSQSIKALVDLDNRGREEKLWAIMKNYVSVNHFAKHSHQRRKNHRGIVTLSNGKI